MTSINHYSEVPPIIVTGANLRIIIGDLLKNFGAGAHENSELINNFFNETCFGNEGLINKLTEIRSNLKFDDIGKEGINLAVLLYDNWMRDFADCMNRIENNEIKKNFIKEIHDKVSAQIGAPTAPYTDFNTECPLPGDDNVVLYFQRVTDYLEKKAGAGGGAKKTIEILKNIKITNDDLNNGLPTGLKIPGGVNITDPSIPTNTKKDFDTLLSFEIGKEAGRTINIAKRFSKNLEGLFTNSIPAINTVVGENDNYKYDEKIISDKYPEYLRRIGTIRNDSNLSQTEKDKRIKDIKREFYLKYLKTKNSKIGNALEQLYKNDFDYSKVASTKPAILKDYFDAVVDIRLRMLFDGGMNKFINLNWGNYNEFKAFYKELTNFDPANPNLTLSNVTIPGSTTSATGNVILPIHKKIKEGSNNWLKDIDEFGKNTEKSYDAFPMEFTINKSDIENMNITIEDKTKLLNFLAKFDQGDKYEIKGENIGNLIYLFFVINSRIPITEFDSEKQKKVEELFGKAKNSEHKAGKNYEGKEDNESNENYTPQNFKEEFERLGQGKFETNSEIWLPIGKSELPGGGYGRMKIKISDVNMTEGTFKGTFYGGELKFNSKLEGEAREFKMNKKTLEELKKTSKDSNKVWLLPDPDNSDFNSFRNNLGGKLGTSELNFPPSGTTWTGNKFMQKIIDESGKEKERVVNFFGAPADDTSTYKVEYNPNRKRFSVSSSFNGDEKGKDGKSEKKRFSYKRDMDWNNFLIFCTQKGLIPQTEKEANNAIQRQDQEFKMVNGGKWKLNWFSFNNIRNAIKDITGRIKKKVEDYDNHQKELLEDILIGDRGLYSKLANILGFIPSVKAGLGELEQEYYNERDNRTWKKIEYYLKIFQADPDFGTTFGEIPPHAEIQGGKSLKQIVTDRVRNANDRMGDPGIYQAAALLLANIEKGGSPYRGLAGEENSGLWIKALLGKAHYEQFKRDKQNCIHDLQNAGKEKDQIQDVLATCEMDYIINNVSGANGNLKYFGCHEGSGIPGKEGTGYIETPGKRLLSNQFADKLKSSYKGRFNKSSVDEAFGKITHEDFNLAKEDFKRLLKSSRFPGAVANLKKMFLLAKNEEQQAEYQKYFLLYMLSGVLDVNGKKDLRKQTYQWAKTMPFLPGMLAKETYHSQKVAMLLDDWSGGEFSRNITSYFREGDLIDGKLKIGELIKELDSRWTVDKMKSFDEYSKSTFLSKSFPNDSALHELQKSIKKPDIENIDNSLLENPLVANSGGLLSNVNVVDDRILFKNGQFEGKDPNEINNRKAFWSNVATEIRLKDSNNIEHMKLLLNQYFNWFKFSDREEIYRWIKTASFRKTRIGRDNYYRNEDNIKDSMGVIGSKEIESVIRYAFKGHTMYNRFNGSRLPDELNDVLDAFQVKFKEAFDNELFENPEIISEIFEIANTSNIQPYGLGSWKQYNRAVAGRENALDEEGSGNTTKEQRTRVKRNFNSGNFINKRIADMERSFTRLPDKQYKKYANSSLDDLMLRFSDTP